MWYSIHFLRAIAAILVVAHHVPQYLAGRVDFPIFDFPHGAAGVDVFFVISGFVMHQATRKFGVSSVYFLRARLLRILPMYWICTLLLSSLAIFLPSLFKTFSVGPIEAVKSLFFLPVYNNSGYFRPVLQQGWTLQYEMLFYLFTGLALLGWRRHASLISALLIFSVAILISISGLDLYHSAWQFFAPISCEFGYGVALGYLFCSQRFLRACENKYASILGFVFLILGCWLISASDPVKLDYVRPVYWGGGAFFVVCGLLIFEKRFAWLHRRIDWLHYFGDSSYVLYLTHGFAFSLLSKIIHTHLLLNGLVSMLVYAVGALLFGVLFHLFCEVPVNRTIAAFRSPGKLVVN